MNSWICYLKVCAIETPQTLLECAKNQERKEKEYYKKKNYWEQQAIIGCPRADE